MQKINLVTIASLTVLSFSSSAFAEEKMHMMNMKGMHHMMMTMMDTNEDGSVSQEEFQAFRSKNFSGADKNRNGSLDAKEFAALAKMMKEQHKKAMEMAKKKKMQKHFDKIDTNGDGKISKAEFDAKGDRSFIRMDGNDDGVLNKKDRKGMMHKMKDKGKMDHQH